MKAVILFNLGGPTSPETVEPFLFNLFYDPAILRVPNPIRYLLAKFLSRKRTPEATHIYSLIGGKSPIHENTEAQVEALQKLLGPGYKVFCAMRYMGLRAEKIRDLLRTESVEEVILLPLYPQFSTTTTASSLKEWFSLKVNLPTRVVCCYPDHPGFVKANQDLIEGMGVESPYHVLFTAHGLPQKVVDQGDPYPEHVRRSCEAIMLGFPEVPWSLCYQSRVGPLKWLKPSTEEALESLSSQKVVLVPIAFVSEHSETLVELDIDYKSRFSFERVPTVGAHPAFIEGLADLVREGRSKKSSCGKGCYCA